MIFSLESKDELKDLQSVAILEVGEGVLFELAVVVRFVELFFDQLLQAVHLYYYQ